MQYLRRVIDDELDELVPGLAAIAIDGARGVGKTETAGRRCVSEVRLDEPAQRLAVTADHQLLLRLAKPLLIDEWQFVPSVWDAVRRQVDRDRSGGQFLLTGSANPRSGATAHSGAGRIVRLRMRPMTLAERGVEQPTVSLRQLLNGDRPSIDGQTSFRLADYVEETLASGLPGVRVLGQRARRALLDSYLLQAVDRDVVESGLAVRKREVMLAWLRAYAAATATTTSYNAILDAATPGESDKPAKTTGIAYRDALSQTWILDPVPGWVPGGTALRRLQQAPKHHLVDPALAAALLGTTVGSLLEGGESAPKPRQGTLLGNLFESLAALSVRVPAQAAEARVAHLRTRNGDHEVDLLAIRGDGRVVAFEVKLGGVVQDGDVRHLVWLRNQIGGDLLDAVVLNTGSFAYRRSDGIAVVPLALLGP